MRFSLIDYETRFVYWLSVIYQVPLSAPPQRIIFFNLQYSACFQRRTKRSLILYHFPSDCQTFLSDPPEGAEKAELSLMIPAAILFCHQALKARGLKFSQWPTAFAIIATCRDRAGRVSLA
jgi:hypothetical protein